MMINRIDREKHRDVLYHGEVYACLDRLNDNSIAVAITSPPYWKQRDYGFKGQIGQENTPEEYIGRLVKVFNKLRQKLKDDGIFFLNIGDKYLDQYGKSHLLQIPYRVAYHMVKDGWYLEDIIIWYKPNHMPESVQDRFTNTYEPILVLAKNEKNIYQKSTYPNVIEVKLEQKNKSHIAAYPENLVLNLLKRVDLKDNDFILDPFAGSGTTAVVVNKLRKELSKNIYSILIEKKDEYINEIQKSVNIEEIVKVPDVNYEWRSVYEDDLPDYIQPNPIIQDEYGEVYIAEKPEEFLSVLKGITTEEFKSFHRKDALYFFGIKNWNLNSLYYIHSISKYGYVLRNMIVVSTENNWYPIFMFAENNKQVNYKFYLDRVRVETKTKEKRNWQKQDFIGMKVNNSLSKKSKGDKGYIIEILEKYDDGFPKIVVVQWKEYISREFVIHPEREELLIKGIKFYCPKCNFELINPYDPISDNLCPSCKTKLWINLDTIPKIEENIEISNIYALLENNKCFPKQFLNLKNFYITIRNKSTNSKFKNINRDNWGASPGARKTMIGEYFTKMRLYKIEQPIVAQYLTILRKSKNMKLTDVINKFPKEYKHTVSHWFRKDEGGSIPLPQDLDLLKAVLNIQEEWFRILQKAALKFQTVKSSNKGKNPGDFIKNKNDESIVEYCRLLYIPIQYEYSLDK